MNRDTQDQAPSAARHGAGFAASGAIAFTTDAAVLTVLTRGAGIDPFSARLIAIACAMIAAFFAHRRLTFAVKTSATLAEFVKFLGVAITASLVNYAIYAGILLLRPGTEPVLALLAATAVAMGVTYTGLRLAVFRRH
ncbi:MAG: GtrA family protein [Hyphomicrobium sp.]